MKFSCSRCSSRYSIADERVKGKVLKIRCKQCSGIITVREGMDGAKAPVEDAITTKSQQKQEIRSSRPSSGSTRKASAAKPRASSLDRAFAAALESPRTETDQTIDEHHSGGAAAAAPQRLDDTQEPGPRVAAAASPTDQPWYLAEHGVQAGPFSAMRAIEWIATRPAGAEIYCWRDGFGDWRLTNEVELFSEAARGPLPANEAESAMPSANHAARGKLPVSGHDDFEIGEVSQIVRLADLMPRATAAPVAATRGAAALVGATSPQLPLPQSPPAPSRHTRSMWYLIGGAGLLFAVLVAFFLFMLPSDDDSSILRRSRVAGADLGYEIDKATRGVIDPTPQVSDPKPRSGRDRGKRGARPGVTKGAGSSKGSNTQPTDRDPITGGSTVDLTPDDVLTMYKNNGFSINRCYERALKKDPFLDIRRADVTVSVDLEGRAKASIPGIDDQVLRTCLESTIRGWRFQRPKEPLRTRITMIFKAR